MHKVIRVDPEINWIAKESTSIVRLVVSQVLAVLIVG